MFCLEDDKVEKPAIAVSGTLFIDHLGAHVLFNSDAKYFFVNPVFVKKLASKPIKIDVQLYITTPLGSTHHIDVVFKDSAVNLEERILPVDNITTRYTRLGCYH